MENNETNEQKISNEQAKDTADTAKVLKDYEDAKERNMQEQSKMIMAISSALFGLLPAVFDKELLDSIQVSYVHTLFKILIVSNAVTLIFALFSYCTANKSISIKQQIILDEICRPNCWACATKFLNFGYLIATCVTVLILATIMWQIF